MRHDTTGAAVVFFFFFPAHFFFYHPRFLFFILLSLHVFLFSSVTSFIKDTSGRLLGLAFFLLSLYFTLSYVYCWRGTMDGWTDGWTDGWMNGR